MIRSALSITGTGTAVGRSRLLTWSTYGTLSIDDAVLAQVFLEVANGLDVGVHSRLLGVRDEHDAVHALQDQLAGRVVEDLARNGVEMEARAEAANRSQLDRQEVEEERALALGRQRDQLALRRRSRSCRR